MAARRFGQFSCLVFWTLAAAWLISVAAPLAAEDTNQPDVENANYQIKGLVNANAVFVRSGPSENDYPTAKLDKGAQVVAVGERFNWLKIIPPEGSFCYVGKAWVNRAGNGSIGQVTSSLYVRIGSDLNPLKTKIATKLEPGERVEIVGEEDEYFKIKPPPNVYLFISRQFVDPVAQVAVEPPDKVRPIGPTTAPSNQENATAQNNTNIAEPVPTTMPVGQPVAQNDVNAPPASQPAFSFEAEFERLENTYSAISQKALDEQPVEELLEGYKKLAANDALPESLRRICDFKAGVLSNRAELKKDLLGARKVQESMKQKQDALKGEQKDLEELVKRAQVTVYTAVGTLRTSSLQRGQQTLYRLTDPSNGRTVVYLRSDDNKLGQYIGQFLGVRGEVETDSQLGLKIITPSAFENVNPAKVGQSVAAQFVPPSLLPGARGTASSGDQ